MSDNWSQEGVLEECKDGSTTELWLNHGVVDLRLVEELLQFVIGVLPSDVKVALTIDVNGWPIAVLRSHGNDGIINRRNCCIFSSHAVEWRKVWIDRSVHDLVLARFVCPNQMDSVVIIDDHVGMPNFVEPWICDLSCIDQRFTAWRKHGIIQVLIVPRPYDVDVSFTIRCNSRLIVRCCSTVDDSNGFSNDNLGCFSLFCPIHYS